MEAVHRELQEAEPESGVPSAPCPEDFPGDPSGYKTARRQWYDRYVRVRPTPQQRREKRKAAWASPGVPGSAEHEARLAKDAERKRDDYLATFGRSGRLQLHQSGLFTPLRESEPDDLAQSRARTARAISVIGKGRRFGSSTLPSEECDKMTAPQHRGQLRPTIMEHMSRRFACFAKPGDNFKRTLGGAKAALSGNSLGRVTSRQANQYSTRNLEA